LDKPIEKNKRIAESKKTEISNKIYFKFDDSNPKSSKEYAISLEIKPLTEDKFKRLIKTEIEVKKKGNKKVCKAINRNSL
tara:strand:- start:58 stop:297 length:240 start_codon:yes stop_codon:yes gene_type:complete